MPRAPLMTLSSDAPGIPDGMLFVTACTGTEELGRPFCFELDLVSSDPSLDLHALLTNPAALVFERICRTADGRVGSVPYVYHGFFTDVRQVNQDLERNVYHATLRPHLWKLSYTRRSRIFSDQEANPWKTVPDLIVKLLGDIGLVEGNDFELRIDRTKAYPLHLYSVQYQETDYDFLHRWLEHEGISYHYQYDAASDAGQLIFTDDVSGYDVLAGNDEVVFDPVTAGDFGALFSAAGGGSWEVGPSIQELQVEHRQIPQEVILREYNYEDPDNDGMQISGVMDPDGIGFDYEYNNNYRTHAEGRFLLDVRRDYHRGRRMRISGHSDHRGFQPGCTFTLRKHFNRHISEKPYVLVSVRHEMRQVLAGQGGSESQGSYVNAFEAQPAEITYRPPRETSWPRIPGVMSGRVVGGSRDYAELDDMGRYKVDIDYDLSQETIGKVRMAQPSVGDDAGFHFPLRKQTEVLLGHVDGDPSRPVILGAVNNINDRNVMNCGKDASGTKSSLRSQGGNVIEMNDTVGSNGMVMANGGMTKLSFSGRPKYRQKSGSGSVNPGSRDVSAGGVFAKVDFEEFMRQSDGPQNYRRPDDWPGVSELGGDDSGAQFAATGFSLAPWPNVDIGASVTYTISGVDAGATYAVEIYSWGSSAWNATADRSVALTIGGTSATATEVPSEASDANKGKEYKLVGIENSGGTRRVVGTKYIRISISDEHPSIRRFYDMVMNDDVDVPWQDAGYNILANWEDTDNAQSITQAKIEADFRDMYRQSAFTTGTGFIDSEWGDGGPSSAFVFDLIEPSSKDDFKHEHQTAKTPGLTTNVDTSSDPDTDFANFSATRGGSQSVTVGDSMILQYGNKYIRHYGDVYNWHSGDTHSFGPNGTGYSYYAGDSVSWANGLCRGWSYTDESQSQSYTGKSTSYSTVGHSFSCSTTGHSFSHSVTLASESVSETVNSASLGLTAFSESFSFGIAEVKFSLMGHTFDLNAPSETTVKLQKLEARLQATDAALQQTAVAVSETIARVQKSTMDAMRTEMEAMKSGQSGLDSSGAGAEMQKRGVTVRSVGASIADRIAKLEKAGLKLSNAQEIKT